MTVKRMHDLTELDAFNDGRAAELTELTVEDLTRRVQRFVTPAIQPANPTSWLVRLWIALNRHRHPKVLSEGNSDDTYNEDRNSEVCNVE